MLFANVDSKDSVVPNSVNSQLPRFQILSWICLKWECFADAASFWALQLLLVGVLLLSGVLQWSWLALSLAICPSEHHDDIMHLLR